MSKLSFNLNDISKYKLELMGISTLLILLCHAPAHIPEMPALLSRLLTSCAYGVDVFLFLSGMGLWYSFQKIKDKSSLLEWYKKRYLRLLLPCFIVQLLFISKPNIVQHILFFTGISYYIKGDGFWFVDMLIPLYLITPLLIKIDEHKHGTLLLGLFSILCFLFCAIPSNNAVMVHTKQVITRIPSFLWGIMLAKYIRNGVLLNSLIIPFLVLPVMGIFAKCFVSSDIMFGPFVAPMIIIICCNLLNNIDFNLRWVRLLGRLSLESYLLNVSFSFILEKSLIDTLPRSVIYVISVILGTLLAYLLHLFTKSIFERLSK